MLDEMKSVNNTLVSLEGTLKIEPRPDERIEDTIQHALDNLSNAYGCTFDKDVFTLQSENQLNADNINLLLRDVVACLADMSLFINLKLFHKNLAITLSDVNYLGFAREQLITSLKYLMDESTCKQYVGDIIPPMTSALNNISMCSIKRMFTILLVLEKLGIYEGVAIMAQILYMGGLVK